MADISKITLPNGQSYNIKDTTYSDATTSAHGLMTAADKTKLDGIASGAEVNVQSDWNVTDSSSDAFIKNKPSIPSAVTESTVSGWGFTKNAGTITGITMNGASKGASGVVDLGTVITSHQDISGKENTSNKVSSWSSTTTDAHYPSEKLVKTALDGKANSTHTHTKSQITDFPTLATVATSGNYNDLSNKPTIPTSIPAITQNNSVNIASSAWSSTTLQATVSATGLGITANSIIFVTPTNNAYQLWNQSFVRCISSATNSLTFECKKLPNDNLSFSVVVINI